MTFIVQLAPPASVLPQVPVSEKSARFPPVIWILILLSPAVPRLVKVTVCGLLVVPTDWLPKFKLVGFSPANGPFDLLSYELWPQKGGQRRGIVRSHTSPAVRGGESWVVPQFEIQTK